MMNKIFEQLKNKLIVSCQAEGDSPFNSPIGVTMMAKAAKLGGAAGIRSEGIAKTKMIIDEVKLPTIGLVKSYYEDGFVRITGSYKDVEDLIAIECLIIAIDGTFRKRENLTGPEFIKSVKEKYNCLIMADISTSDDGLACFEAGADCLSTTLSGYTPETEKFKTNRPDFNLVEELTSKVNIPVFAEGRVNTPIDASKIMKLGAWGVIAGTAITRPNIVTQWYVDAINEIVRLKDIR
jgi:N-acylglucosamine-6-phosphate 2-epimerase